MAEGIGRVQLLGVPTDLYLRSTRHSEELIKELRLMQIGDADAGTPMPGDVAEVVESVLATYAAPRDELLDQVEWAATRGESSIDLVAELPVTVVEHARELFELYRRADELCRDQQLLAMAADEDVWRLRSWMRDQLARQLVDSQPPVPWTAYA